MSALTRLSLANRGLVALIAIVISGFGIFAIPSLKQQLFPSIELPSAFIGVVVPGGGPEIIEEQVTRPIEDAVKGIDGIDGVRSTTREGSATIVADFVYGTDIEQAVNQLTTAVNRIQPQLPDDVEPTIFSGGTDDIPAIVLAASGGSDETALLAKLNQTVVPELNAIEGVRDTQVTGARTKQVVITPDLAKMGAAGVNPQAITTVLQANGVSIPAGSLVEGDKALNVQVGSPVTSVDGLKGLYLTGARGPVKLSDVAAVESKLPAATSFTRTDGADSLGIVVTAKPDGNPVLISHEVRDQLADLEKDSGAKLTVVVDQAPYVEKSIESLTTEGLLGLLMAVIVILIFLLSVRSTLVTAVSIPLSVLVALIALWIGDYTLNLLTLGALTIAVGRVVDDSIVVLENIKRHLEYGEPKAHAIISAVKEVSGAVTASTLTTVAVFLPIALVGGLIGQIFASFAVTVTVALLASLFVALTVVPVLAYWFLKPPKAGVDAEAIRQAAEEKERRSPLQRSYLPVIRFATKRRWATVLIGVLVLLGTGGLATQLQTNFLDQSGQDSLNITQEMPVGTSLAATDAAAKKVEDLLKARDDVKTYQVTIGNGEFNPFAGGERRQQRELPGGPRGGRRRRGGQRRTDRRVQEDDRCRRDHRRAGLRWPGWQPARGERAGGRRRRARHGDRAGAGRDGVGGRCQGRVHHPGGQRAAPRRAGEARRGGPRRPHRAGGRAERGRGVPLRAGRADHRGRDEPGRGRVVRRGPGRRGGAEGVADHHRHRCGAAQPDRRHHRSGRPRAGHPSRRRPHRDGQRHAASGSDLRAVNTDLTKKLTALTLPAGASYSIGGASADQADAFKQLGLAVLAAIAIVFIIMVATFRSLVQPIILLVSIPFAATGAIALLLPTGTALGVPALIGVLMLVGIVVTNAIVLMDLINHYRAEGMGVQEAVIEGGRHRLRPILMTAIATIFALLPMALGLTGEGGFISQPLAIVVIGGLVSSTLLTLVLVPALYTMVENRKEKRRAKRAARRLAKQNADLDAADNATESSGEPHLVSADATPAGTDGTDGTAAKASGALRGYTDQFEC